MIVVVTDPQLLILYPVRAHSQLSIPTHFATPSQIPTVSTVLNLSRLVGLGWVWEVVLLAINCNCVDFLLKQEPI